MAFVNGGDVSFVWHYGGDFCIFNIATLQEREKRSRGCGALHLWRSLHYNDAELYFNSLGVYFERRTPIRDNEG